MGRVEGYYIMPHPPVIIPEVGKGEEEIAKKTINSCKSIGEELEKIRPDTIVIISPHGPLFRDAISLMGEESIEGNLKKFGEESIRFDIKLNKELSEEIVEKSNKEGILSVLIDNKRGKHYGVERILDHGAMVPLYFINKEYENYNLVHITYGLLEDIELYRFGSLLKEAIEKSDVRAVIIASGDLSHKLSEDGPYGYSKEGEEFDKTIIEYLKDGKVEEIFSLNKCMIERAGECGLRSFYILLGAIGGKAFKGELLSYEASFGIGYGVMSLIVEESSQAKNILEKIISNKKNNIRKIREKESEYVKLARESLEYYIKNGEYMGIPSYVSKDMTKEKRGVFVSLKKDGELRGCIGTVLPVTSSVAEEIIRNAVEAGEEDPRFNPVEEEELDYITYSVDEIMPFERCTKEQLDPKRYGVIVRSGMKSGLLLPDLEGVDTVDEQINIALRKAGINPREDYITERFEVIRHV